MVSESSAEIFIFMETNRALNGSCLDTGMGECLKRGLHFLDGKTFAFEKS